jgi:hypothetical protein
MDSAAGTTAACDAIAAAMVDARRIDEFKIQKNGMQALVEVFRRYMDEPEVMDADSAALSAFNERTATSATAFTEAGGMALLVQVLSLHTHRPSVAAAACRAVAIMTKHAVARTPFQEAGGLPFTCTYRCPGCGSTRMSSDRGSRK